MFLSALMLGIMLMLYSLNTVGVLCCMLTSVASQAQTNKDMMMYNCSSGAA